MRSFLRSFALAAVTLTFADAALAKTVTVTDATTLTAALGNVAPGDEIVLADGTYAMKTSPVCAAAGTQNAPIVVRAANPLGAKVTFDALEGFHVTGPFWRFEGLDVRGVCATDSSCEHAFHVTGAAHDFALVRSRLVDFNAQLKVNADLVGGVWTMPNHGLVESCEVFDTHARATSNPVTKLNIDTVDDWVVRSNFIHDGHKNGGDQVSYQSFIKGGGKGGLYEKNLVVCTLDDTTGGTRIGLSFGGGGTAPQYCSPAFDAGVPCAIEHTGGTMRDNLIVNCSDVGIYLNQSKDTHVLANTLVATNGVDFRFANTSGEADGNVLASVLRVRNGGTFTKGTNLENVSDATFASWFVDPAKGNFRLKGDVSALVGKLAVRKDVPDDYCSRTRSAAADLGALQVSLGDCATVPPPRVDAGAPTMDAGTSADAGAPVSADASADATTDGGSAAPADDTGCACDTSGAPARTNGAAAIAALGAWVLRSRRRRP